MTRYGSTLMTEQSGPKEIVRYAAAAERAGFDFEVMSDHYSPWLSSQGHAAYAWSMLGAVTQVTDRVELMTYVTSPIMRHHPAVVAQKAATIALLGDERFLRGLGSGENLNEHVVGRGWPPVNVRHEMFAEAIEIISRLLEGGYVDYAGDHFRVDSAKVWDLPEVTRWRPGRRRAPAAPGQPMPRHGHACPAWEDGAVSQPSARYRRSAGGMVGAMLVLGVLIIGWVAIRSLTSDAPTSAVQRVDYARDVPVARKAADFDLVAPPRLPQGWQATTVRYTPAPGAHWHLGVLTDARRYVGLEQSRDSVRSMVRDFVDESAVRGPSTDVAGVAWSTYNDEGGDLALVRRAGGTTTLVVGHEVPRSALVSYAASLR
jgi:hypothetical protein